MATRGLSRAGPQPQLLGSRLWHIVALLILYLLLYTAAGGVARAMRGPAWSPLWQAAFFGMVAGWLIAALKLSPLKAVSPLVLLGAVISFTLGGRLGGHIGGVLEQLNRVAMALPAAGSPLLLDYSPLAASLLELVGAAGVVAERVGTWLGGWRAGRAPFDPVATSVIWAFAVWGVSAWAGWWIRARRNPIPAALPAVIISVVTLTTTGTRYGGLYLMLGAWLLLVAAVHQELRQEEWQRGQVAFPAEIGWDIGKRALLVAAGIVLLTAIMPSISVGQVRDWLRPDPVPRRGSSPGITESLGLRRESTPEDPLADVRRPGLPREHLIGAGPELSQQRVMRVHLERGVSRPEQGTLPALYWRALTYDVYTGSGWRSGETTEERYQAEYPVRSSSAPHTIALGQRVELIGRQSSVLLTAGELVSVDRGFSVARRGPQDVFAVTAQVDDFYRAVSLLTAADEQVLRSAGRAYPDWVRRRYLQLPGDLPGRVRSLALELTATERTPYDRARALEDYLREYSYTLDVDRPPLHQDVVDFFLFEERQGYCDYYASSMAVLARAAGIPARLAIGYASGTFDEASGSYLVTEAEAHSWVELYFPGVGWVPFEPTAGRPGLDRTALLEYEGSAELRDSSVYFTESAERTSPPLWRYAWLLPGGALLLGVVLLAVDDFRLRRGGALATSARINRRLRKLAGRLGGDLTPGATPAEVAHRLTCDLSEAASRSPRLEPLVRGIKFGVERVSHWIMAVQFRSAEELSMSADEARWAWRGLWVRGQLLVLILVLAGRFGRVRSPDQDGPWRSK